MNQQQKRNYVGEVGENFSPFLNFSLPPQSVANSELFDYLQISTPAAAAGVAGPSGYVHVMWAPPHSFVPGAPSAQEVAVQPVVLDSDSVGSALSDIEADDEEDSEPSFENSSVLDSGRDEIHYASEATSFYDIKDVDPGWSSLIIAKNVSNPAQLIFRAIRDYDEDLALQLARLLPNLKIAEEDSLESVLHVATMVDSPFLVRRLIDMGADPNQLNKRRRVPLHLGVKYVMRMCVVELLEGEVLN